MLVLHYLHSRLAFFWTLPHFALFCPTYHADELSISADSNLLTEDMGYVHWGRENKNQSAEAEVAILKGIVQPDCSHPLRQQNPPTGGRNPLVSFNPCSKLLRLQWERNVNTHFPPHSSPPSSLSIKVRYSFPAVWGQQLILQNSAGIFTIWIWL